MILLTSIASCLFVMGSKQSMTLKYGEIFILPTKRNLILLPEKLSVCHILTKPVFPLMADGVKKKRKTSGRVTFLFEPLNAAESMHIFRR